MSDMFDYCDIYDPLDEDPLYGYLEMSDADLRRECRTARLEKIRDIRDTLKPLTERQRFCLASWAVNRDAGDHGANRRLFQQPADALFRNLDA